MSLTEIISIVGSIASIVGLLKDIINNSNQRDQREQVKYHESYANNFSHYDKRYERELRKIEGLLIYMSSHFPHPIVVLYAMGTYYNFRFFIEVNNNLGLEFIVSPPSLLPYIFVMLLSIFARVTRKVINSNTSFLVLWLFWTRFINYALFPLSFLIIVIHFSVAIYSFFLG
ncbi:MAG: hypothetical protein AAGA64_06365 [Bacteroidota bacterium]